MLGKGLLDNAGAQSLSHVTFNENGAAARFVFRQTPESLGFWGRNKNGVPQYTIVNVNLTIEPLKVTFEKVSAD